MNNWTKNLLFTGMCGVTCFAQATGLADAFQTPPDSAKPGVYWYFMDGNQDRDEMVADLEAMNDVGIGRLIYLEVNIGVPPGPVKFMTPTWQDNFANAIKTTERLGMEFVLGTGPGWSGSGGSWVPPEESMQHLVGEAVDVEGPVSYHQKLPVPPPHEANRFSGMNKRHKKIRNEWYCDVAVLAYPCDEEPSVIQDKKDEKTLKNIRPYTVRKNAPRFLPMAEAHDESGIAALDPKNVIDLTGKMNPDGTLNWEVPEGKWKVYRFVARSTGQTTRPAPRTGHGFECDKMNPEAYRNHWNNFQGELLKKVNPGKNGIGWTTIHLDSWEMSSQNWTAKLREEFQKRRGYDPLPFYPAFMGTVVDNMETTERFLWDLRTTAQELVIENHAMIIKEMAHDHGMLYSNEPYDMNPAGDIDLGSVADVPMCEFWHEGCNDGVYSCIEAASIAHVMGRPIVAAESFTASAPIVRFDTYPGKMKNQLDWAFAIGINSIYFHTFQHQPLGEEHKPGMYMGRYGVNWHRNQTWWDMLPAFHTYMSRCSHMLRQGSAVGDILYLTTQGAPNVFLPPPSAMEGANKYLLDKKGYAFDAVTPSILMNRASVKDGLITFPEGGSYRVLVLPDSARMTPAALKTIAKLIEQGATVIGKPPVKSPSFVNYPACDQAVEDLAKTVWGGTAAPENETVRTYGKGAVYWGGGWTTPENESVYPPYDQTEAVLQKLNHRPDFVADKNVIRHIHRKTADQDIYFVSNRTAEPQSLNATFRVTGKTPKLWDPETGSQRALPQFKEDNGCITVPLQFAAHESYFIIFDDVAGAMDGKNFQPLESLATLDGLWNVSFDPDWGGPENIIFPKLIDWRDHEHRGIQYYSGTAIYRKKFDLPADADLNESMVLDLGKIYEMARVELNGKLIGTVWSAPYQIELDSTLLKAKDNELEIEVANSWENRIIGDKTKEDRDVRTVQWDSGLLSGKAFKTGRYTFSTHAKDYKKKTQPSGLIGPVILKQVKD